MTYEGIRLRLLSLDRSLFRKIRNKKLVNKEFTIISNNCWGGMIYDSYGLRKNSPTVGMFIMADDYIKFISDLRGNTSKELTFIDPETSRYADILRKETKFGSYPVGKIDDMEIMFLHSHSEQEAKEKWERRCQRINWDKLIVKFNDQNGCTEEHVKIFNELPFEHKLFFTVRDWPVNKWNGFIKVKQNTKDGFITTSHEPYVGSKYINLTELINGL
ncbi:Uncharacterized protein, DUF1919 family [Ruminococcaceae bacterium YAD3003]|nr:Uncharacterized protein, DUF1919 family [Ruminococcaceae bacterium YAD3003]